MFFGCGASVVRNAINALATTRYGKRLFMQRHFHVKRTITLPRQARYKNIRKRWNKSRSLQGSAAGEYCYPRVDACHPVCRPEDGQHAGGSRGGYGTGRAASAETSSSYCQGHFRLSEERIFAKTGSGQTQDCSKTELPWQGCFNNLQTVVRKTPLLAIFILKVIFLPRQAREKHRES
jgi:hypothetical protein